MTPVVAFRFGQVGCRNEYNARLRIQDRFEFMESLIKVANNLILC